MGPQEIHRTLTGGFRVLLQFASLQMRPCCSANHFHPQSVCYHSPKQHRGMFLLRQCIKPHGILLVGQQRNSHQIVHVKQVDHDKCAVQMASSTSIILSNLTAVCNHTHDSVSSKLPSVVVCIGHSSQRSERLFHRSFALSSSSPVT